MQTLWLVRAASMLGALALLLACGNSELERSVADVDNEASSGEDSSESGTFAGPPASWLVGVRAAIAASEYRFRPSDGGFEARNRAQDLRAHFARGAVQVGSRSDVSRGELRLTLQRFGRTEAWSVPRAARPRLGECSSGSRVDERGQCLKRLEHDHGGVIEWWENRSEGLEQGFTFDARPAGRGPLELLIQVTNAAVEVRADGSEATFVTRHGLRVRYSGLVVKDAEGRALEAWLTEHALGLAIVVRDENAKYPIVVDPLLTTAGWSAESDQAAALFGSSVASAGDVNGDGYSDVLVGAPDYVAGADGAGRAYLYLGSDSGLEPIPAWTAEGAQANGRLGYSVAGAGDVNGDGYSDAIVGAPGESHGQTTEGRAYVYLGTDSGLEADPAWSVEGEQAIANLGQSVATAGDVNGDGYSDVVIGAHRYDNGETDEGRAYVYLGSGGGLALSPAWTSEGDQGAAFFGRSVASAGDVNGDGFSDVVVGAYGHNDGHADQGRAYLYLGSASGVGTDPSWVASGAQQGAWFGRWVASAGDVNGDGFSDVIVGAPSSFGGESNEGRAHVYLGSASGLGASAASTLASSEAAASYGNCVAGAGDVNGDGYADVIVGAMTGDAHVYRGSSSGLITQVAWRLTNDQPTSQFGAFVASAGDVDGDGLSDVIAGAPLYDGGQTDEGAAFVYGGSASGPGTNAAFTAEANQPGAQLGTSVAGAGDVNGDGYADVIVGAELYDGAVVDSGRVVAYMGSPSGISAVAAWTAESDQSLSLFGRSLGSAGDVNGDGYADVIVGAPRYANGELAEGRAFVYLGSAAGLEPTAAWLAEGDRANALFGVAVRSAGDVNGDGFSDVVVGAPGYENGDSHEGRAYVYLGSSSGLAAAPAWTAESNQALAQFGDSVASAGDVNGDGYSDVVVGAPGFAGEGYALVYHGSAAGLGTSPEWSASVDQVDAEFGASVAGAGDINGDGFSDVVVGAPGFDNEDEDQGRAFVYHGSAAGLGTTPAWNAATTQVLARFGQSVAGAGDVNGDGYADVLVGVPGYTNGQGGEGIALVYMGSRSGLGGAPWLGQSAQANANLGTAVAGAGDVNGDGYSDVIIGAPRYDNGQADEGRAFLFLGNGADGTSSGSHPAPQARRHGTRIPIVPMGRASSNAFDVRAAGRTPFGRGRVRLLLEVKPRGTPFDGGGLVTASAWTDTGILGKELVQSISDLAFGSDYHWRARVAYDPSLGWAHGASPWLYGGAPGEPRGVHVRTSCPDGDSDGTCDAEDSCPSDPAKTLPGVCDCNVADTDSDGDEIADCMDACPAVVGSGSNGCPEGSGGSSGDGSGGDGSGGDGSSGDAGSAGARSGSDGAGPGGVTGAGGTNGSAGREQEDLPGGAAGMTHENPDGGSGGSNAGDGGASEANTESLSGSSNDDSGCGCRVSRSPRERQELWALILFGFAWISRRRRKAWALDAFSALCEPRMQWWQGNRPVL